MTYLGIPPETTQVAAEFIKGQAIKKGTYGPGAFSFKTDLRMTQIVDLVGNLGIMAWQFLRGKKRAKRRSERIKKEENTKNEITNILNKIYNAGMELVSQGINPTTSQFEQKLYDLLFQKIGYKGNCNAIVWVPDTKPGKDRPVWFRVENNGRTLIPVTLTGAPPNLQSYWYSQCAGAKTDWMREYRRLLIALGRSEVLSVQEAQQKKAGLLVGGGVYAVVGILAITIIALGLREETE